MQDDIIMEKGGYMKEFIRNLVTESIRFCLPDEAVKKEIKNIPQNKGKKILISVGKAAYQMAKTALDSDVKFDDGLIITKYGHLGGEIKGIKSFEAGHPISDANTIKASRCAYNMVKDLSEDDQVVMLISGGGSALFELPLIDFEEIQDINSQLLEKGANIVEINTIRKRLSKIKGGKFAKLCEPAEVYNIILSDVVGNRGDMIASGPTYVDYSTSKEAIALVEKYNLKLSDKAYKCLESETEKELDNVITKISGSVDDLCFKAKDILENEGYKAEIMTTSMANEAREIGFLLGSIGRFKSKEKSKQAYIFGGETIVHIKGSGKGGRNQELAFASAREIEGLDNITILSYSSDGTDGPTDAAGGFVDGNTMEKLRKKQVDYDKILENNDSYNGLLKIDQLIKTGPTGTNVNDVSIILIN